MVVKSHVHSSSDVQEVASSTLRWVKAGIIASSSLLLSRLYTYFLIQRDSALILTITIAVIVFSVTATYQF
jgi:hypothetical protein